MPEGGDEKRLFKIGEVCRVADVQPYVLRYWETEFPPLAPGKSGGGQRLYTQREIDVILRIKQLLYSEGFTIAGAKKKLEAELSEGSVVPLASQSGTTTSGTGVATPARLTNALATVRHQLQQILDMLNRS